MASGDFVSLVRVPPKGGREVHLANARKRIRPWLLSLERAEAPTYSMIKAPVGNPPQGRVGKHGLQACGFQVMDGLCPFIFCTYQVAAMEAAKEAVSTFGKELDVFVFAT